MKIILILISVLILILNFALTSCFADSGHYADKIINFKHEKVTDFEMKRKVSFIKGKYYKIHFKGINPITQKKRIYKLYYYVNSKRRKNAPTIIILPPAVGLTGYDFAISHYFQSKGHNMIILPLGLNVEDERLYLEQIDDKNIINIEKIRSTLDILPKFPGSPHPKNIFVMGVSLGAIASVYAIQLEPRIKAAVVYMGGTTIKDIFETASAKGSTKSFIDRHYNKLDINSKDEFREYLDENIEFDLDNIPLNRDPDDIYMFIATKDHLVKTKLQFKLREEMGNPKYHPLWGSHTYGAMTIPFKFNKIHKFFKRKCRSN